MNLKSYTSDDIQNLAYTIFSALPTKLNTSNVTTFSEVCEYVDHLCGDNPNLYRLLMPFHYLTFGWQPAYGDGFTWEQFLKDIIEDGCIDVVCSMTNYGPALWFEDKSALTNDSCKINFCISMEHDD